MPQKCHCMKCKKELGDLEINEDGSCPHEGCEGRSFVYADNNNFTFDGNNIVCQCGSKLFKNSLHMDFTNKYVNNYQCSDCGSTIGTEGYRSKCDPMNEDY